MTEMTEILSASTILVANVLMSFSIAAIWATQHFNICAARKKKGIE